MGYRDSNRAVPDPGTSSGKSDPMVFSCAACEWTVRSTPFAPGSALLAAKRHQQDMGHGVTWKGVVRDFSRVPEEA